MEPIGATETNADLALWRRSTVEARTGIKRSQLYLLMSIGSFPKPVRLGPRAVAWIREEVLAFIAARIAESRSPAGAAVAAVASEEGRRRIEIKKARKALAPTPERSAP